jgi:hypothetical protein
MTLPGRGWYLYGITRHAPPVGVLTAADAPSEAFPLQVLEDGGLAAVVRRVRLADYAIGELQPRLQIPSELEAIVRSHNRVIDAIHARQAILPAKFGSVYARSDDIASALRSAGDTLRSHLQRLEGCDEWAVHLYANRGVVRGRALMEDPAVRRLSDERAKANPGRAYFLERRLLDALKSSADAMVGALARQAFQRLADRAVSAQATPIVGGGDTADECEILRAAFLVPRDDVGAFRAELVAAAELGIGLRSECSGPWAPYSFALPSEASL